MTTTVDYSWIYGINMAARQGWSFGSDLVFTHGPLGYLLHPLDVGSHARDYLVFKITLAAAAAVLVYGVLLRVGINLLAGLFYLAVLLSTALALDVFAEHQIVFLVLLSLLLGFEVSVPALIAALCLILSAATLLMKFSAGVICLSIVGAFCGLQWWEGRMRLLVLASVTLVFPVTLLILFPLSGSRLQDLGAYLLSSIELASGYGAAMSRRSDPGAYWFGVLPMIWLLGIALFSRAAWLGRAARLSIIPFFLSFKHGFIREDLHILIFLSFAFQVAAVLTVGLAMGNERSRGRKLAYGVAYALIVVAWLGVGILRGQYRGEQEFIFLKAQAEKFLLFRGWERYVEHASAVAPARLVTLGDLSTTVKQLVHGKSVDVIPWDAAYAETHAFIWKPRPVFQSYSAYTRLLDDLNAAHFRRDTAPEFVIYEFKSIDGRHPFFDEPHTWREVMCRYALRARSGSVLVLERQPQVRCGTANPFQSIRARWGQEISIPGDQGGLVASIHIRLSLTGKIFSFLFRPPRIALEVKYADDSRQGFRFIAGTAGNGLLLGKLPRNLDEVEDLLRGNARQQVASIRLLVEKIWAYHPDVDVQLSRLKGAWF